MDEWNNERKKRRKGGKVKIKKESSRGVKEEKMLWILGK